MCAKRQIFFYIFPFNGNHGDQEAKQGCLCPQDSRRGGGVITPKILGGGITPKILGGGGK